MPLHFDGESDSIYHPFDQSGQRHMEYVHQRGAFDDMPLSQIVEDFQRVYGGWLQAGSGTTSELHQASFAEDVAREALRLAIHKLPMKARFIKRESGEF